MTCRRDIAATGRYARSGDMAMIDRYLQCCIYGEWTAGAHDTGETGFKSQTDIMSGLKGLHHRWAFGTYRQSFCCEGQSWITGVKVTAKHTRHDRPARQVQELAVRRHRMRKEARNNLLNHLAGDDDTAKPAVRAN